MVPAQLAASSIKILGPRISARSPRFTGVGKSVTSIAIMSIEMRPMMGQRLPLRYTCGGVLLLPELRARGIKGAHREVAEDVRRRLVSIFGRGMIERHVARADWRAVANRWERDPAGYRYFTQFVENMTYKETLFLADPAAPIDINAQPDLDLMTFLLDADAFVTNEKGFARRAFDDIWRPRGKVMFTNEEFARLVSRM